MLNTLSAKNLKSQGTNKNRMMKNIDIKHKNNVEESGAFESRSKNADWTFFLDKSEQWTWLAVH